MSNEPANENPPQGAPDPEQPVRPPYPPAQQSQPPAPQQGGYQPPAPQQPGAQQPGTHQPAYQPPPYQQQPPYQQNPQQPPYGAQPPYGTPQYPDLAVPAAYPGAPVGGAIAPQYPGYGGPSAYAQPAPSSGVGGMAIAALVVGIGAFIFGWVPFFGLVVAVVGIVLGVLALRQPRGKGFGITALVLSGLAALSGIFMIVLLFVIIPASENQYY